MGIVHFLSPGCLCLKLLGCLLESIFESPESTTHSSTRSLLDSMSFSSWPSSLSPAGMSALQLNEHEKQKAPFTIHAHPRSSHAACWYGLYGRREVTITSWSWWATSPCGLRHSQYLTNPQRRLPVYSSWRSYLGTPVCPPSWQTRGRNSTISWWPYSVPTSTFTRSKLRAITLRRIATLRGSKGSCQQYWANMWALPKGIGLCTSSLQDMDQWDD